MTGEINSCYQRCESDPYRTPEMAVLEQALNAPLNGIEAPQHASGSCKDCSDTIEPARMRVLPDAVTCFRCQTHRERRA